MSAGVGQPARVLVWLNPRAGLDEKRDLAALIQALFRDRGLEAEVPAFDPGDLAARMREAVRDGRPVVAGGGDGTLNTVAALLVGTTARLGVLPLGTLNHFARDLGIPMNLEEAVDVIAGGAIRCVDVGDVNDRIFLNNSSIGIYPSIVQARDALQRDGHGKWMSFGIAAARLVRHQRRLYVRMEADGRASTWHTPFVMVGNNEYDMTGLRLAGRSRLDAGRLFTYVAPHARVRDLPKAIAIEAFGRLLHLEERMPAQFRMISANELWIDVSGRRRVQVAVDGEVFTMQFPLHYRSRPAALRVFCPGPGTGHE